MKLIALFILSLSMNAFACSTQEAQFSSVVKEVVKDPNDPYACFIKLDLNLSRPNQSWTPSSICPLSVSEVIFSHILVKQCGHKAGDKISGYIIKTESGLELD